MRYRVLVNFEVHKFSNYSEALMFKLQNGGIIYEKVDY